MAFSDSLKETDRFIDRYVYALRHFGPTSATPGAGRRANTVRLLLIELTVYANWDTGGDCYPSRERIASRMGVNVDTVTKAIAVAVELGWLLVFKTPPPDRKGQNWNRNRYQLVIPPQASERLKEAEKAAGLPSLRSLNGRAIRGKAQRNSRGASGRLQSSTSKAPRHSPGGTSDQPEKHDGTPDTNPSDNPSHNPPGSRLASLPELSRRARRPPKRRLEGGDEGVGERGHTGRRRQPAVSISRSELQQIAAAIRDNLHLGHETVVIRGQPVGMGLEIQAAKRMVATGIPPEELPGVIRCVRISEGIPPDQALSMAYLESQPAILARARGHYHKQQASDPISRKLNPGATLSSEIQEPPPRAQGHRVPPRIEESSDQEEAKEAPGGFTPPLPLGPTNHCIEGCGRPVGRPRIACVRCEYGLDEDKA